MDRMKCAKLSPEEVEWTNQQSFINLVKFAAEELRHLEATGRLPDVLAWSVSFRRSLQRHGVIESHRLKGYTLTAEALKELKKMDGQGVDKNV